MQYCGVLFLVFIMELSAGITLLIYKGKVGYTCLYCPPPLFLMKTWTKIWSGGGGYTWHYVLAIRMILHEDGQCSKPF